MLTAPAAPPRPSGGTGVDDTGDLGEFGYEQQLHRSLGKFASFAAGFSFVSILTTIFQLFGLGFGFAGPAFFWTWPVVFVGQFMVALNFAELAARYPISGAIYQWSRRMGGEVVGWFAGWFMILAQIVTASAAAIALQVVLPNVWSGFQIIGEDSTLTSAEWRRQRGAAGFRPAGADHLINCIGVNWMSRINNIGVTCEIVGVIAVIGMFLTHAQRGPEVVFDTGTAGASPGYGWAWIVSGLMAAYVMVGFGSAGELAEETRNPRRVAPRTIRLALSVSALGGGLMIIGALMAAPSLTDGRLAAEGLPYVLSSILSSPWGTLLLVDVAIAVFVCTLAIQTAASRLMFSMARDGRLPASQILSKVNTRTGTPIAPSVLIGLVCIGILAVNVGNSAIFTTLSSVCIILIYLAYLMVTVPLLLRRLKGWPHGGPQVDADGRKLFSLGRFGLPVNIAAVALRRADGRQPVLAARRDLRPQRRLPPPAVGRPVTVAAVVALGVALLPARQDTTPNPVTIGA